MRFALSVAVCLLAPASVRADPPASSYLFPAGGRQGSSVECRVGGLNLSAECGFSVLGEGIAVPPRIRAMDTLVLVGPYHHNPVAQQSWDYPQDMAATVRIDAAAPLGVCYWYCTTAEGATELRPFVVGDLDEVLERERRTIPGDPQPVHLPVTVNGRIYPRGDLDEYFFRAGAGTHVSCEVMSQRLGHKLDARLELIDNSGRLIAQSDDHFDRDPLLLATLPADGDYVVRIHDVAFEGDQDYVYRMEIREGPYVTHLFPAGGRAGERQSVRCYGHGLGPGGFCDREIPLSGFERVDPRQGFLPGRVLRDRLDAAWTLGCPFHVGPLVEIREEDRPEGSEPQRTDWPVTINGRLDSPQDSDRYALMMRQGEVMDVEVIAERLGSPLLPVVEALAHGGSRIAALEGDGNLQVTSPVDGEVLLDVRNRFREPSAGQKRIYRLVVSRSTADFHITLADDHLGVQPGAGSKIKVRVVRQGGFQSAIRLSADGLPPGVTLKSREVPSGTNEAEIEFVADPTAAPGDTRRVKLTATADVQGQAFHHSVWTPAKFGSLFSAADTLAVTVVHPPLFSITRVEVYGSANRGATLVQSFSLARETGFEGDVIIRLADRQARYLQGVTGPTIVCKAGQTEFDYPVFLPDVMDLNRTARMLVMGTAQVSDAAGVTHYVTRNSQNQIVCRVCPSLLTLTSDDGPLRLKRGAAVPVRLRAARTAEVAGDLTVEAVLPEDLQGVSAESVTLLAGQEQAHVVISLTDDSELEERGKLHFRATGRRDGHPVVAETWVEYELEDLPST
jgi:hypothetical protein